MSDCNCKSNTNYYSLIPFGFIAAVVSYALNHSFWWAVLHWFFGSFYLIYAVCERGKEILPALSKLFV